MVIEDGGVLTCVGSTDKSTMGRVWVQCTDLTVKEGGKIDVSECGYLSPDQPSSGNVDGYGPGASISPGMGASHGGLGGLNVWSSTSNPLTPRKADFSDMLYDDAAAPVEPGSSGRSSQWKKGGSGGGAVRIEASGRVTVAGSILASGGDTAQKDQYSRNAHGTAGAGGSIYITCATFAGTNGVLRADGGKGHFTLDRRKDEAGKWLSSSVYGYEKPATYGDMAGGGGRIAIHYSAEKQSADAVRDMTISAAGGVYATVYCCKAPTLATIDRYHIQAGLGTLHFTDGKILENNLGKGLSGQIVGFSEWTCDSLDFTAGFVRFAGEGFALKVAGDLKVTGENVRLDLGGVAMTNRVFRPEVWAGASTVKLEVGGDVTVSGGARLDVRASETNEASSAGAVVTVGKTLTVGDGGHLVAWCDPVNGGSPRFEVTDLTVAAGGLLTAEGRGYAGAVGRDNGTNDAYWNDRTVGYGPTPGFGKWGSSWAGITFDDGTAIPAPGTGGSHGGLGGLSTIAENKNLAYAATSDDEWRPSMPGSGGGAAAMSYGVGAGGGVIRVSAKNAICVDGEVNADAGRVWSLSGPAGGGAGGTIFLEAKTFAGAATGVLTARGGDVGAGTNASGAGGGGRIAVWTGEAFPGKVTSNRISKGGTADGLKGFSYFGTATATGGTNEVSTLAATTGATLNGADGTVRFAYVGTPSGLMMVIR